MPRPLRVATRSSALARWQAERVAALLGGVVELVLVTTAGDARTDAPIHELGGTGVFVKEVQAALLDGRADLAVHSAKDLPASDTPEGLVLAAVPERADPRDALVGSTLAALPPGARIATGSVRRRAQLAALRPDLTFSELRGNIATRLAKAHDFDAIVMALAALVRLDLLDRVDDILDPLDVCPQVGQGALAVECRVDDADTQSRLDAIDDTVAHTALDAERAFLARLGGGCDLPCGALAQVDPGERSPVTVRAVLASLDGRVVLRGETVDTDPVVAGRRVAEELLEHGGAALLDDETTAGGPMAGPVGGDA